MCQEVKGIEHRYVRTSGCGSSTSQGRCSKLSHDLKVFEAFTEISGLDPWKFVVQFSLGHLNTAVCLFALFDLGFRYRNICTTGCSSNSQGRCSKLSHDLLNI